MVVLETWWDFFLKNMFLNPKRKLKPVLVPCVLKTPEINVTYTFSQTSLCRIRVKENPVLSLEIC